MAKDSTRQSFYQKKQSASVQDQPKTAVFCSPGVPAGSRSPHVTAAQLAQWAANLAPDDRAAVAIAVNGEGVNDPKKLVDFLGVIPQLYVTGQMERTMYTDLCGWAIIQLQALNLLYRSKLPTLVVTKHVSG